MGMAAYSGEVFAEDAYLAGIPARTVRHKGRNWGLSFSRAEDLAEDAAAEAYHRSLTHCFHNEEHYRAWVTQTAINLAIDKLRRESRSQSLTWLVMSNEASDHERIAAILAGGLATLAQDERELLTLTYEEGWTLDQIARLVTVPEAGSPNARRLRVKRKRDQALRKLKTYLVQLGYGDDGRR
jgi:RNA polymerase sigma factor (sigma-70 family)